MNASSTNTTTYFLREPRALEMIRDLVAVPATAAGRRARVWSVGCSSGDEPYGLAMLCLEAGAAIDILATDVNPNVAERARRARYPERNLRHVEGRRRERWFRRVGDGWEAVPELRERVEVALHDVTTEGSPCHDVDIVLCRNVIVYFDPAQLRRAVATMLRALRPGGMLVLGASEWLRADLRNAAGSAVTAVDLGRVIVYQRTSSEDPVIVSPPPSPSPPAPAPRAAPPVTSPRVANLTALDLGELEVNRLRTAGDALLDGGRVTDAVARYDEALVLAPLLADLHLRLACCHLQLDATDHARAAIRRALFLRPALWPAWLLLADLCDDPSQRLHCLAQARSLLESPAAAELHDDPTLRPFTSDHRVALDAVRRRISPPIRDRIRGHK